MALAVEGAAAAAPFSLDSATAVPLHSTLLLRSASVVRRGEQQRTAIHKRRASGFANPCTRSLHIARCTALVWLLFLRIRFVQLCRKQHRQSRCSASAR